MTTRIKNLTTFAVLFISSLSINAQNSTSSSRSSTVTPLKDFSVVYKEKYDVIANDIKNRESLTISEKLAIYENEISKLKEDFRTTRKEEYLSKSAKRAKRLTCTGIHTRNVTKCQAESINAPNSDMYTKEEWIEVESTSDVNIVTDKSSVTLSMSANGKRTNKAVVYVTYKYKPENISDIVTKEMTNFFNTLVIE